LGTRVRFGGRRTDNVVVDGRRIPAWLGATLVVVLAAVVGAPGTATAAQWRVGNERRAVLFGDSLSYEASSDFTFLAQLDGFGVEAHVNGGTAPCDWLGDLAELVARPPSERPTVAVIEFSGNAFTPCMRPGGVIPSDPDIVAAYQRDATTFVTTLLSAGVRPVFALAPAVDHASLVPQINDLWRSLAAQHPGVAVVDAGAPVEADGGSFTRTLPCGPWEGPAQGCDGSVVVVRAPDGAHFCPTETETVDGVVGLCPVPSPGAVRYAMGLAEGLDAAPVVPIPDTPTAGGAGAQPPAPVTP
jgi:hypothetical protein